MKLLLALPLTIIVLLSVLSLTGLGTGSLGELGSFGSEVINVVYYDQNGNPKCYANGSAYNEAGWIEAYSTYAFDPLNIVDDEATTVATWCNYTLGVKIQSPLYWDSGGEEVILFHDVGRAAPSGANISMSLTSSLGLIALIVGVMVFATFVGIRVLGSGTSEFSVGTIVLGTCFLMIWGVFSVLALNLILNMALLGPILYFVLTTLYTVGVITSFGGGAGGDD